MKKENAFKRFCTSDRVTICMLTAVLLLILFSGDGNDKANNESESTIEPTTTVVEVSTEETTSKKATVEKVTVEEVTTEEATTEEATTDKIATEQTTVEKTIAKETITEQVTTKETTEPATTEKKILDVNCILQLPDLPTGCEITSLAIVLNYKGVAADKCDLADNYLEKGKVGTVLPTNAFLGNPRDNKSYGCYSPVIVKTANSYLAAKGSSLKASDLSGSSFESLLSEIDAGNPIVIWATLNMAEPYYSVTWNIDGQKFTWKSKEHCLVLTGYDMEAGVVYVADPMKGNVTYNMNTFKDRYEKMYSQAVVIK